MMLARFVFIVSPSVDDASLDVGVEWARGMTEAAGDLARRLAEAVPGLPVAATWLVPAAVLLVGVLIMVLSRRRSRHPGSGPVAA